MVLISIATLLFGPLVYELGRPRPMFRQFLDGLVFVAIAGIAFVHIIPEAIAVGGWVAIAFLFIGLAFPVLLEHRFHDAVPQAHSFILLLGVLGIVVHAAIDGIALVPERDALRWYDNQLALSVVLHRLPVGMAIWWFIRPNFGRSAVLGIFALIIVVTLAAYVAAEPLLAMAEASSVAWFQAFVSGSLLHIAAFGASHDHPAQGEKRHQGWAYRAGILLGLFLLLSVLALDHSH